MKNLKGFTVIEGLLILVILGMLGGLGWFVYSSNTKTNKTLDDADAANNSTFSYARRASEDIAPDGWKYYFDEAGDYSFYYPPTWSLSHKGCNPGLVLLGPNEQFTGRCGTEYFGQITIYSEVGEVTSASYLREGEGYVNVRRHDAPTAGGIVGSKQTGEASGQQVESEIGTTGLPDGTEVTFYLFRDQEDGRTHTATYRQLEGAPNVLADFDRVVSTLDFGIEAASD